VVSDFRVSPLQRVRLEAILEIGNYSNSFAMETKKLKEKMLIQKFVCPCFTRLPVLTIKREITTDCHAMSEAPLRGPSSQSVLQDRKFRDEVGVMHMGNVLRYVVDESFSKECRNASRDWAKLRRWMKRHIHKMERKMAKADLQKGREINGPSTILTDRC
jgi:hypothetical protein